MATVDKLLQAGVFNAVVIFRDIQALGYDGKIRVLRAYIEPRRAPASSAGQALRPGRATECFKTEPVQQLQHDWGEVIVPVGGTARRVHITVSVLGYSRWRNSGGYAGCVRGIVDFSSPKDQVSTKAGQLQ